MDSPYKRKLLPPDCPRRGDIAAVVRDHHSHETGIVLQVINDPHYCENVCAECGALLKGYFVEVAYKDWLPEGGPYYMPVKWLRRVNQLH